MSFIYFFLDHNIFVRYIFSPVLKNMFVRILFCLTKIYIDIFYSVKQQPVLVRIFFCLAIIFAGTCFLLSDHNLFWYEFSSV